jgi:hypothetical protein
MLTLITIGGSSKCGCEANDERHLEMFDRGYDREAFVPRFHLTLGVCMVHGVLLGFGKSRFDVGEVPLSVDLFVFIGDVGRHVERWVSGRTLRIRQVYVVPDVPPILHGSRLSVSQTAGLPSVFPLRVIIYTEQNLPVGYSGQCKRENP